MPALRQLYGQSVPPVVRAAPPRSRSHRYLRAVRAQTAGKTRAPTRHIVENILLALILLGTAPFVTACSMAKKWCRETQASTVPARIGPCARAFLLAVAGEQGRVAVQRIAGGARV